MIVVRLPFPPSLNRIYKTRRGQTGMYLSAEGKAYKELVKLIVIREKITTLFGRLNVFVTVHAPDNRSRDIMNLEKISSDALQDAGVFKNDNQIDSYQIVRGATKPPVGELIVVITEEKRG